ncbi:alginate export family protein [Nitrosomonas halophila]|nr:alginate export family protein [Nitrosomonas halophila]
MLKNIACSVLLPLLLASGCVHLPDTQIADSNSGEKPGFPARRAVVQEQVATDSKPLAPEQERSTLLEWLHMLERHDVVADAAPVDMEESISAAESLDAVPVSAEAEQLLPPEKVQQRLLQLDEGERERRELEELSPAERTKRLLGVEEIEPVAAVSAKEAKEAEGAERVKRLIGIYARSLGIYDEILDKVQIGPGYFARQANLPRWLTIGGEHRTRFEHMNGQFRRGLRAVDQQLALRTRLFFSIKDILDPFRLTVELQDSRAYLTHADSNVGTTHIDKTEIQQLHLDLIFKDFFGTGLPSEIRVGRVNMDLGRGRWIARNNFRNTTNAFDGLYWKLGQPGGFQSNTFAVWPVDKFERALNPFLDDNENFLWGSYVTLPSLDAVPWLRTELSYHGHSNPGPYRDFTMLGYRFFKRGGVKEWEFEIESDYQFGKIGELANFAHFHHGELGYTFDYPWKPQFLMRFDYASPGFDILYGRRSFELTPTGILGPFQRNNLISSGYRLLVQPSNRYWIFFQHRANWLADPTAPWVGTGLRDPSGQSGSFLGHTLEIRTRLQVLDNLFLQAGYMHFAFGSFARNAPESPVDRNMNYAYFWTEFMF